MRNYQKMKIHGSMRVVCFRYAYKSLLSIGNVLRSVKIHSNAHTASISIYYQIKNVSLSTLVRFVVKRDKDIFIDE
jgi:hypothetical protein